MRILLVAACLTALIISAWSNPTVSDAKLRGDFTINQATDLE
jgi:hypothetical protein